jgi:hypothetical protein
MGFTIHAVRQEGNATLNSLQVALTVSSSITRYVVADGNGRFFYRDGGSGGGGTPGGSSGQIQYNSAGSFGGVPTLTYDGILHVTGGFKGNLDGNAATATYATTAGSATTANYATTAGSAISASYAATASYFITSSVTFSTTASFATSSISASYATTASLPLQGVISATVNSSTITFIKGDGTTFPITVAQGVATSTAAVTINNTQTGIWYPTFVVSGSNSQSLYVNSSSFSYNPATNTLNTTSSYAATASYFITSSVTNATSASLAATSSTSIITNTVAGTLFYPTFVVSGSGQAPILVNSSSFSYNATTNTLSTTASYAATASYFSGSIPSASYAGTASNINGGAATYIPLWNTNTSLSSSVMYQSASSIGIGTTTPNYLLHVSGGSALVNKNGNSLLLQGGDHTYMEFYPSSSVGRQGYFGYPSAGSKQLTIANEAATGNMVLITNSSTRLFISASGEVGIGTTNPSYKLDVANQIRIGAQGGSDVTIIAGGSGYGSTISQYNASGVLTNYIAANNPSYINGGAVGIGVTSPNAKLDITGSAQTVLRAAGTNGYILIDNAGSGNHYYAASTAHSFQDNSNNVRMYINSSTGNVGIGTITPSSPLHVIGLTTIYKQANSLILSGSDHTYMEFYPSSSVGRQAYFGFPSAGSKQLTLANESATGDIVFITNSSTRMTILSGGNVGIGTTSPGSYKLNVNGGNSFLNGIVAGDDSSYGSPYKVLGFNSAADGGNRILASTSTSDGMYFMASTGNGFSFRVNGGTTNNVVINSSGNVGVGTTNPFQPLEVYSTSTSNVVVGGVRSAENVSGTSWTYFTIRKTSGGSTTSTDGYGGAIGGYLNQGVGGGLGLFTMNTTGLVERLRIDQNGYVGINTPNPQTFLHVSGAILVSQGTGSYNAGAGDGITMYGPTQVGYSTSQTLQVTNGSIISLNYYNGFDGVTSQIGSMMWIQATEDWTSSPVRRGTRTVFRNNKPLNGGQSYFYFHDTGQVQFDQYTSTTSFKANPGYLNGYLGYDNTGSIVTVAYNAITASSISGGTTNYIPIWSTNNSLGSSTIYQTGGNVGINTTSPGYKLDVSGKVRASDNGSTFLLQGSDHTYMEFYPSSSVGRQGYFGYPSAGSKQLTLANEAATGDMVLITNSSTRLFISASGNVGIGTTSPASYKLEVNGTVGATGYYETSDITKKTVLEINPNVGLNLDVIKFIRKDDESNDIRYGYSAQQVRDQAPELINPNGELSVKYIDVHTLKIAELEKRVLELETIIKKLINL